MKKVLLAAIILTSFFGFSQAPKFINYQGVARNSSGVALANTALSLTITISNTSSNYTEEHLSVSSNSVGIFTLLIGNGTSPSSSFPAFNWAGGANIQVWINAGFGSQYLGLQPLVSVPYALYAETSGATSLGTKPTFTITAPHTVVSNTTTNGHFITIASPAIAGAGITTVSNSGLSYTVNTPPTTASFSAGILTLNPGGDTTMIGGNGPWAKTGSAIYPNNLADNVGIGTVSPSAKLTVQSGSATNDVQINSTATGDGLQILKLVSTGNAASISLLSTASTATAVAINNTGMGTGIHIDNATGTAIIARSTGSIATILGANWNGSGPSVRGSKATTTGNAGIFDITFPTSSSDALVGSTVGNGAGVRAVSGAALTSTVALWVDNGHIKSTAAIPPIVTTFSVSGGSVSGVTFTLNPGATDVKGSILAVITTTGMINPGNNATLKIAFTKNYATIPTVIITPTSDFGQLTYFVSGLTNNSFNLTIKNSTTVTLGAPVSLPVSFNYFVIE